MEQKSEPYFINPDFISGVERVFQILYLFDYSFL